VYKNFTYQNNATATPFDYTGNAVAGVPKNVYNFGLDLLTNKGVYFNATYLHRDAMPITSDGTLMTDEYNLLNSKIGYRRSVGQHLDLDIYFGANNITNARYYQMVFINQQPDTYLPGPRWVNYFGGVNLKYTF
jgi:iron complex outermembrane receptor protein